MFTHLSVIFCLHTPTLLFLTISCPIFTKIVLMSSFCTSASDAEMLTYAKYAALSSPRIAQK